MSHIWIPQDFRSVEQGEDYSDAQHERKPHGIVIVNGQEVATTLQCCHCGMHYVSRKGSGIRRGFCLRHMQVTCGQQKCVECKPGPQDEL
jgi:hypothetical protein